LDELRALASRPKVVAIGEIGLDFYRDLSPREKQRQAFEQQLALASEVGKPVIIHDREAHKEVMTILRRWAEGCQQSIGVLHCFSGDLAMAKEAIKMGFYISIAGPVTFPNARRLRELVRQLPLEKLLVETDCPYLTPHPHRGKRNEPAYVKLVAQEAAHIKGLTLEEVARVTSDNARALFALKF
jgi:TatD DNase family protein